MSNQPLQWMRSAAPGDHGGQQSTAVCAMCGIELPTGAMVPDGGEACADVRWYCRDAQACTRRWTQHQAARTVGGEWPHDERAEHANGEQAEHPHDEQAEHADGERAEHEEPEDTRAGGPVKGAG